MATKPAGNTSLQAPLEIAETSVLYSDAAAIAVIQAKVKVIRRWTSGTEKFPISRRINAHSKSLAHHNYFVERGSKGRQACRKSKSQKSKWGIKEFRLHY
jgi:hypothetical protein